MTDQDASGQEVRAQARDNSFLNTEPLVARAAVVGFVTSVLIALGAFGLVTEDQRTVIIEQVGNITYGIFVILPMIITLVTALVGRLGVYSPRTAARIAVDNAPVGKTPSLQGPP